MTSDRPQPDPPHPPDPQRPDDELPDELPPAITAALRARAARTPPIPDRVDRAVRAAAEDTARLLAAPRRARRIWTPARLGRAVAVAATLALCVTASYLLLPSHPERGAEQRVAVQSMQGPTVPAEAEPAVPMSVITEALPPASAPALAGARGEPADAGAAPDRPTSAAAPASAPTRQTQPARAAPPDALTALRLALAMKADPPADTPPAGENRRTPAPPALPEPVEVLLAQAVRIDPGGSGTDREPRPTTRRGTPIAEPTAHAPTRTLWLILDAADAAPARPAAWQVDLRLTDPADRIVGVLPGSHPAFMNTLRFDPLALNGPRIILAGISTAPPDALPREPAPVARLLVASDRELPPGEPSAPPTLPPHTLRLIAVGDAQARPIDARARLSLRPEPEPDPATTPPAPGAP
jgi:hypothetical protein